MHLKKLTYLTLSLTLILVACSRTMSYEEMGKYISNPKNGLVQEKEINGINIKLTYRPSEMLVYQELHSRDSISKQNINEARERYGKQHYFVLSVSQGGKEILCNAADRQRFSMLVNQFAFGMDQCVILTTAERDTLQLLDFNYPRYFGMAASTDILFAFEKEKKETEFLQFSLKEFGLGTGDISYRFDQIPITKISSNIEIKNK